MKTKKTPRKTDRSHKDVTYAFDNSLDGIVLANAKGEVVNVNRSFSDITGIQAGDIVGKMSLQFLKKYFSSKDLAKMPGRGKSGKKIKSFDVKFRDKILEIHPSFLKIKDMGVFTMLKDVTSHKKMEEQLHQHEEYYRSLINASSDGITISDLKGNVLHVNSRAALMKGYKSAEELMSAEKNVFEFIVPADRKRAAMNAKKTLEQGKVTNIEYNCLRKDGSTFPAEISATVFRDRHGKPKGFIGITRDISHRRQVDQELRHSLNKTQHILGEMVNVMSSMAGKRDPYTALHQQQVSKLACKIGRLLKLNDDQLDWIRIAGELHDIGKIYIPAEILNKPGRLVDMEMALVKVHPQSGYDIIKMIPFTGPIADITLQHHERVNGSGYPSGLKGKDILLETRIISVADVVEAMFSHRPYRPALGIKEALNEIRVNRGILYDPDVVDACFEVFKKQRFKF